MLATDVPQPEVVDKQGHRFLKVGLPQKMTEATFFALLYPTSTEHPMSSYKSIRADGLRGMEIEQDVVLWSQNEASWEYADIKTDARFAARREEAASIFVKSARFLEWSRFSFRVSEPVTAILTEEEARLVLSAPTEIIFTDGYMSRAGVYQTDQDRDLSNDRRVGQVDDSGQVTIAAGAFTIRR